MDVNLFDTHRGRYGGQAVSIQLVVFQVKNLVFHQLHGFYARDWNLFLEGAEEVEQTDAMDGVKQGNAVLG